MLQVKITAKDLSSLEKSKAIISNLTMVPKIGDVYRSLFDFLYLICSLNIQVLLVSLAVFTNKYAV